MATIRSPLFYLFVTGQIEAAYATVGKRWQGRNRLSSVIKNLNFDRKGFPEFNDLFAKYFFLYGQDWVVTAGLQEGITQITRKSFDSKRQFVWKFPLNITFKSKSTDLLGWPRLFFSVYGQDVFGNDVKLEHGEIIIPISPGSHIRGIQPRFIPESSSHLQKLTNLLLCRRPNYVDPTIVAQRREVARVRSQGSIEVIVNVNMMNLRTKGYDNGTGSSITTNAVTQANTTLNMTANTPR